MINRLINDYGQITYPYSWYSILGLILVLSIIFIPISFFYYYLILIPMHELGHLLFSKLSGGTILSFRINIFTFINVKGKMKVKIYSHQGSAGQCIVCPKEYTEERHPFMLGMLGGSILDFILSFISLMIYLYGPFQASFLNLLFALAAFLELLSALLNGIPMKINGINNDGMCTLMMKRDRQAVRSWYATTHILQQLHQGKTYKAMNQELFHIPLKVDLKNDIIAYHQLYLCYLYMDHKQWEKAFECLKDLEIHGSKLTKKKILADKLFLSIKLEMSPWRIDDLYEKTRKILQHNKYDFNCIRTRMAYELYKDSSEANRNRIIRELSKISQLYPYEGEAIFNRNLII